MFSIDHVRIEYSSPEPERLQRFYSALFGMKQHRRGDVYLVQSDELSIEIRNDSTAGRASEDAVALTLVLAGEIDAEDFCQAALELGAQQVRETKLNSELLVTVEDPDGNRFVVISRATRPEVESPANSLVPRDRHAPGPRATTRRDWDLLADSARLASMQEAIAGLMAPFTATEPRATLDEMREKVSGVAGQNQDVERSDRELEMQLRAERAEELLSLYKTMNQEGGDDAAPRDGGVSNETEPEAKNDESATSGKSLSRSPDAED